MTNFYSHNTIRKYTIGLLDTFNDLKIERNMKDNTITYPVVPITYGSKDKAFVMSAMDIENWKTNNYNVLPRMALSLITMNKRQANDTNKLHKINKTINGKNISFQYNAVSYTFSYELAIATRSMTELSTILEQILPHFNPTYNLRIKELDIQDDYTSVPVSLMSVDIDTPNNIGQDEDIRICSAIVMLDVRGNIYQPFTDASVIQNVRLYLSQFTNDQEPTESLRSIKYEFDINPNTQMMDQSTLFKTDWNTNNTIAKNAPDNWYLISQDGTQILNQHNTPVLGPGTLFISGLDTININILSQYIINFVDVDDEQGFTYIWNILSGNATIIQNNINPVSIITNTTGVILLQAQVMDNEGNLSNYTTKTITAS
jgi:hypothetical protein